jgi:hypothetical protein
MELPSEWTQMASIDNKPFLELFWSDQSKGYLLALTKEKTKLWERQDPIDTDKIKGDHQFLSDDEISILSLEVGSRWVKGHDRIQIKFSLTEDHDKIHDFLSRSTSRTDNIVTYKYDENEGVFQLLPVPEREQELRLNYPELFRQLASAYVSMLEHTIKFLTEKDEKSKEKHYRDGTACEVSIDFLVYHCLREVLRGINLGIFCGIEYNGATALALIELARLIEHAADDTVIVLRIMRHLWMYQREAWAPMQEVTRELTRLLDEVEKDTHKASQIFVSSIGTGLDESKLQDLNRIMGNYFGNLVRRTGRPETDPYITRSIDKERIESRYYGTIGQLLEIEKLSTASAGVIRYVHGHLQRIARVPRNIAVVSLFLKE